MIGQVIAAICCFLCAIPFFVIAGFNKDSNQPINFWSGDTTLKDKVKNVKEYNREMSKLYKKYAVAFLVTGITMLVRPKAGVWLMVFDCSLGIYLVFRAYKKILSLYS